MSGLSRPDRRHVTAGVDPTIYWEFQPGQRVMTREGIAGMVTAVEDGPYAGAEQYLVELDAGLGGGEYGPGELRALEGTTAYKTAACTDECNEMHTFEGPCDQAVENLHTAAEDYPELGDILVERPNHEHSIPVTAHKKMIPVTAGPLEWMGDRWQKGVNKRLPEDMRFDPESNYSVDWCRFRKNERCMYPKELDIDGTREAGYAVWHPVDRGHCPRHGWDQQKACPIAEPGPNSKDPKAKVEATEPWNEGGQRGGEPSPDIQRRYPRMGSLQAIAYAWPDGRQVGLQDRIQLGVEHGLFTKDEAEVWLQHAQEKQKIYHLTEPILYAMMWDKKVVLDSSVFNDDPNAGAPPDWIGDYDYADAIRQRTQVAAVFEFTAGWKDIQQKAKRIRSEGGVQIVSASPEFIVGYVQGDTNRYETRLQYEAGTKRAAMWECGCDWALYSWGRSGRWKKYEGRMCSHALALQYEASARGMFGREVQEDKVPLKLNLPPAITPGERRTKPRPFRVGMKEAAGQGRGDARTFSFNTCKCGHAESAHHYDFAVKPPNTACGRPNCDCSEYRLRERRQPKGGMRKVETDPFLQAPPAAHIAAAMLSERIDPNVVMATFGERITMTALTMSFPNLKGLVRGVVRKIKNLFAEERVAEVEGIGEVPAQEILYPTWHPTLGLDFPDTLHDAARHEADADTAGVMVCVRPPDHVCEALVGLGTEDIDNLHVTLAYLGKTSGVDHDKLHMIVAEVADRFPQLMGKVGGYGLFLNGEQNVVVALIDSSGLEDVQVHLTDALQQAGLPVHSDHGYTPHLTLSYTDGTPNVPKEVPAEAAGSWPISDLIVSYGDEWVAFPMTGLAKAAGRDEGLAADLVRSFKGKDVPDTGDQVSVYRDLSKETKSGYPAKGSWSIKKTRNSHVYAHTIGLRLRDCVPEFNEAARRKAMTTGDRQPFAYIRGTVDDYVAPGTRGQVEISFYPDIGHFFDVASRRIVVSANEVIFESGNCWGNGVSLGEVVAPSPKFEPDLYAQWSQRAASLEKLASLPEMPATGEYARKFPGSLIMSVPGAGIWYSKGNDYDPSGVTVHAVFVDEAYRRKGLATLLLDALAEKFAGHAMDPGGLTDEGAPLWEKWVRDNGWTEVNEIVWLDDEGEPWDEDSREASKKADWAGFIADEPDPFEFEGAEAELKPTPEGALPEVTAEDPPAWTKWEPPADEDPEAEPDITHGERSFMVASLTPSGESATIRPTSHIEGDEAPLTTGTPAQETRTWLMEGGRSGGAGPSDGDIAARARQVLAMKAFTPAEQSQLINEGEGVVASNLDRLDIAGTHYEALEAALDAEDEEEGSDLWLGV